MMRIVLLSYDFGEYCVRLANGLSAECEVLLLLPKQLLAEQRGRLLPAVRLIPFDKPRLRQPLQQVRVIWQLLTAIRAFRPNLLHFQHRHLWFNMALPLVSVPLVLTVHDAVNHVGDRGGSRTPEWVMRRSWRRARQLIVHGNPVKQQIVQHGVADDKVTVMPHIIMGADPVVQKRQTDEKVVLFFGRIWPYKGLDQLIKAQPLIARAVPTVHFIIAGAGEPFDRYQKMMADPKRFDVHNRFVSDEERAALFQRADLVALPYIEASQSGVIPVAYCAGKPVVATTVGGLPEAVEHGETGLLVRPNDVAALARAIIDLLQNDDDRLRMGANARQKIEAEAGEAAIAKQTLAVYQRALNLKKGYDSAPRES